MTELARLIEVHKVQAADVEKFDVGANHQMTTTLFHHRPKTGLEAKFSMEFCMAILLLRGKAGLSEFSDQIVQEPDAQEMIGRINFYVDPEAGWRAHVVCHEGACPNRRCPCLEVTDLPGGVRVNTFPDSNTGEPGADQRPSFTSYIGKPDIRLSQMVHAIRGDWQIVYWPDRRAAIHGHEALIGRLLRDQSIDDLGV